MTERDSWGKKTAENGVGCSCTVYGDDPEGGQEMSCPSSSTCPRAVIEDIVEVLALPGAARRDAAALFRELRGRGITKGRSIQELASACVYLACREHGLPVIPEEVSEAARSASWDVDTKALSRRSRFIVRELGLKLPPATKPSKYVPKICSSLGLEGDVVEKAVGIAERVEENHFIKDGNPKGIAAATTYISSVLEGDRRIQDKVARAAGVTVITVRNRYKEIVGVLGIDMVA